MTQPHIATDRSGDGATTATLRILYADADATARERIRSALLDSLDDCMVRTAGSVAEAREIAAEVELSCLAVDPETIDQVPDLVDAAGCPAVLYTEQDPAALPAPVVEATETVVEKGSTANRDTFLAEKLRSVAAAGPDRSEYALRAALDGIEAEARDDETTVLVDDGGEVVWSDAPVASVVFGDGTDRGPVSNLFEWLDDVAETGDQTVRCLRRDPSAVGTVRITVGDANRHVLLRGDRLPDDAGSLRLVILSDVTERARAEARHAMLDLLVEHAQDGLYTLDERGVVDFCNESFARSLGYEPDEVLGTHASELLAPGELSTGQETIQTLLDEDGPEETTVELTFECRDGSRREMSIHYALIRGQGGAYRGLMGVLRDVTARKERERALERSQRRFEAVFDSPISMVQVFAPDGTIHRLNAASTAFMDIDEDAVEGTPMWSTDWFEAQAPDVRERLRQHYRRAAEGEYLQWEEPVRDGDGESRVLRGWVQPVTDGGGSVVAIVSECRDVTAERRRERALQRNDRRFEAVLDSPTSKVVVLEPDGTIDRANDALAEFLGTDRDTLEGSELWDTEWYRAQAEELKPKLRTHLERAAGGEYVTVEEPMRDAAGRERIIRSQIRPVTDEDGTVLAVVSESRDVTEARGRQRELRRIKERLELAVDGAELGIWDWDLRDGDVTYDGKWEELLGYDGSDSSPTHDTIAEWVHPDDVERTETAFGRLLDGEDDMLSIEVRVRTATGDWTWVRAAGRVVQHADGEPTRVVGVIIDIDEQKARERALETAKQRLELAVEGAGLGIWDRDIRTDEVTYAGRWGEMLGYDTAALAQTKETWAERVHPDDLPRAAAELERLEAGEIDRYQLDMRMRTADDDWKWVRSNGKVVEYEEGEPARMVGIHIDIDEEKARERELRRANERLELAVEGPGLGIWDWDVRTDGVTYDGKWAEMLGYDPEELTQTYETFASRAHPDDLDRAERELDRLLAGEIDLYQVDIRMRTADGDWNWVRAIGKVAEYDGSEPVRVVGIHVDIDDKKARERELQSAKERLELAVEGAELGVWDWNIQSGSVAFDGHWADMLGYSLEELDPDQETWEDLIHPDDVERAWAALEGHFDGETEYYHCDHRLRTADGDWKWIRDIGKVFEWNGDGEPVRAVGIHQDIDDQKRRQREIERQRDELETLDRIHVLIQDIIRTLGEAAGRADLERTLCERLVESDLYRFAWVGERGPGDRIVPRTSAGDDDEYLDEQEVTVDKNETGISPAGTAFRTGDVTVTQEIATCERFGSWREAALSAGFESMVAIPLVNDEIVHGVLCVYADRPDAFGDRVRETFGTLGETAGFALAAIQNRQLLQRDTVVEMEFESTDRRAILYDMACEHGCRIESLGIVDTGAGDLEYFRVDGAPPAAICERLREAGNVAGARVVRSDGESGGTVELKVGQTSRSTLLEVGARQTEMVADPESQRVTIEAPTDADPRVIRESLVQFAPGIELTAKRKRSRSPAVNAPETDLRAELTDRQREILRTAYLAGYYAWPRDTTAEELAETLDIASPTLHQHLRRGTRNVLAGLFD